MTDGDEINPVGQILEQNRIGAEISTKVSKETVNHPSHYNSGKIECIDYIEDIGVGFNIGNAIKYLSRALHKGKTAEDYRKAIWYIQRELALLESRK